MGTVNQKAMLIAPPNVRVPRLMYPVKPSNVAAPDENETPPLTVPFHVPILSTTVDPYAVSNFQRFVSRPQYASRDDGSGGGGLGGGGLGGGGLGGGLGGGGGAGG